ncbi:MAG: polyprenol monophosphomannose synthase [Patescibacteria group bacterium]|nr:polyprenol monophosphomannose synthase [Patescibacteria group bacterium]
MICIIRENRFVEISTNKPMKSIVILPTYNERENITKIVPAIMKENLAVHILIADDNSPDGTGKLADGLAKKYPKNVFVLHRAKKEGLGRAYLASFQWALDKGYEVIIQMDADFSHHPKYLKKMLGEIKNNDLVIGSRYVAGGGTKNWGVLRKIISRGGSLYAKTILWIPLNDLTGGFKCWRASLLKKIDLVSITSNGYSFQIEMNYRAATLKARIKEIPIIFADRDLGASKMSKAIFLEAISKVWQLKFGKKSWLK